MNHEHEQSRTGSTSAESAHSYDDTVEPGQSSRSALLRKSDHAAASGLVQRKARDANGVSDGAEHAVGAASSSSGSPLPDTLMRKFESSLGAGLPGVRIHTGAASEQATDAVGAKAYTMGNDIHFGAGHYDPSSPGGQHLLAHEVAHTVQQAGATTATQYKLEVSSPSGAAEVEADCAADAMVRGEPAGKLSSTPATLSRVPTVIQAGQAEAVASGSGQPIQAGHAGYARAMLAATGVRAEGIAPNHTNSLLTNEVPDLAWYSDFTRVRAREAEAFNREAAASPYAGAPSAAALWHNGSDWCHDRMLEAELDHTSEQETFDQYNAWVPRANGFFTSYERLQAQSQMIGHGNDTGSLAAAIMQGLDEAGRVAHMAQLAFDQGSVGALPPLPSGGSLLRASNWATHAAREMNTAYLSFRVRMVSQRAVAIDGEGAGARAHLEQINAVKEFLRNVGTTVDVAVSVVGGAPAAIANATEITQRGGASIAGARNRRQIVRGERPTHNPTYVTADENGNMVVRNMQTGTEAGMATGDLPIDVESLLGSIAGFAYAGEVREINQHLEQIQSRVIAANVAASFIEELRVTEGLQDKLNNFAMKCLDLQACMVERRQQYLEYGVALDNFARSNAQARGVAGGAPSRDGDHYATIMTLTSAIREAVSIGSGAKDSFMSGHSLRTWAWQIEERRSRSDCPQRLPPHGFSPVRSFECTRAELARMNSMREQVEQFGEFVDSIVSDLGPVHERARLMVRGLHQGGGSGEY